MLYYQAASTKIIYIHSWFSILGRTDDWHLSPELLRFNIYGDPLRSEHHGNIGVSPGGIWYMIVKVFSNNFNECLQESFLMTNGAKKAYVVEFKNEKYDAEEEKFA